jgi:hypothetical protein
MQRWQVVQSEALSGQPFHGAVAKAGLPKYYASIAGKLRALGVTDNKSSLLQTDFSRPESRLILHRSR